MTTTYHLLQWLSQYTSRDLARFRSVSLPNQKEFNKKWSLNFQINQNLKILLLCTAQDYNLAISHLILSQIFDTARNAYCILSDQYTDISGCFLLW